MIFDDDDDDDDEREFWGDDAMFERLEIQGPCCACGESKPLRNILQLNVRAPASAQGKGWGCAQCGVACDGALAVLCDACIGPIDRRGLPEHPKPVRWVCAGYIRDPERAVYDSRGERFVHDLSRHPEEAA